MGPKAMLRMASFASGAQRQTFQLGTSAQTSQHFQVLIVEDDDAAAALLVALFESHYPEVRCTLATDGLDAVLQLERMRPQLLITDLIMEPFDGFRLLNMVNSRAEYRGIATVALSGLDPSEIDKRGGLPPGVLFLTKPLNMDRLRGFIDAQVQFHRQLRATA